MKFNQRPLEFIAYHKTLKGGLFVVCDINFDQQTVKLQRGEYFVNADFSEVNLLQFTGLKDRRGQKIFEGHIIKIPTWDGAEFYQPADSCIIDYVVYENGCFTVQKSSHHTLDEWNTNGSSKRGFCEIIGNIFENPELLK